MIISDRKVVHAGDTNNFLPGYISSAACAYFRKEKTADRFNSV